MIFTLLNPTRSAWRGVNILTWLSCCNHLKHVVRMLVLYSRAVFIFNEPALLAEFWICIGYARFALKFFSLISEIKRNWIRFTCVSLFHYEISLLFFRFFSLIFASNFSLRFTWVIFTSKRNKAKRNSSLFLTTGNPKFYFRKHR